MNPMSITARDVDQQKLVEAVANHLKKTGKVVPPDWIYQVKTGVHKEIAPVDEDWYYTRCAAILRRVYMHSPAGVGRLSKMLGGRQRKGTRPSHYCPASRNHIRKALQALESMKLIEPSHPKARKDGRCISKEGKRVLDRIATTIKAPATSEE